MNIKTSQTPANVLLSSQENAFKDMVFYQEKMLFWLSLGMCITFIDEIIVQ